MSRRVLFLNHSASRNGASLLLLHQLEWLRGNSTLECEVLSYGNGPLIEQFRAVAITRVWRNPLSSLHRLGWRWADSLATRLDELRLRLHLAWRRIDLVYANTAATWGHVAASQRSAVAVLWHIHELPYAIAVTMGRKRARELLSAATRVIAVSRSVSTALVEQFAVEARCVDLIHGFVPDTAVTPDERRTLRRRVLNDAGWPDDAFVVGACGGLGWRKGSDLFLQIARRVQASRPNGAVRFLWVGGGASDSLEGLQFEHDLAAMGLEGACLRVPSTSDVESYYCAMDVFALTSREDPFPLVMLEAARHEVPTVCFAGAGGGPEFVADGGGMCVPYLDIDAFAGAIEGLHCSQAHREAIGQEAQRRVRLNHCLDSQGPKLLRSIELCLAHT